MFGLREAADRVISRVQVLITFGRASYLSVVIPPRLEDTRSLGQWSSGAMSTTSTNTTADKVAWWGK